VPAHISSGRAILKGHTNATSKRAFKASHLPDQWRPCDIPIEGNRVTSADPLKVLNEEARKLAVLWHETVLPDKRHSDVSGGAQHGTDGSNSGSAQCRLGKSGVLHASSSNAHTHVEEPVCLQQAPLTSKKS